MFLANDRPALLELSPMLHRAVGLDPAVLARLRLASGRASGFVRLPFDVLVGRSVPHVSSAPPRDMTVRAGDVLAWLAAEDTVPQPMDTWWRSGLPPVHGWRRLDTVPDDVVRALVRRGALAVKELAASQSLPSGQAGPQAGAALLDTSVLTVDDPPGQARISLRTLSALTRMGFAPRGGTVHLDLAGRWLRAVGGYGTVYQEHGGSGLSLH